MDLHPQATTIRAVPAIWLDCGFRLLVLRQFHVESAPPAFAWIEQRLLRAPQRLGRHGLSFANTFLPEVMAWLGDGLGRPSLHDRTGRTHRNPRWPVLKWHGEDRAWPDGTHTTEWFVDVSFQDENSWSAFRQRWYEQLTSRRPDEGKHTSPKAAPKSQTNGQRKVHNTP
ncbi:hypothetical protein [Bradyrhizobium sp. dw_78]|uniref:hypothetical protein n=1 Tax=Bradyrhizobium sp. dw_78 TaxID=2719793 RepID=UPI001BD585A2|nr:hypothetical protein [Bradyrhizobium sp. dw_78]